METSAKLYSLNYSNVRTYLFALLFVTGNIALPQICHLVPYLYKTITYSLGKYQPWHFLFQSGNREVP